MGDVNNIVIGGATVSVGGDLGYIRDGITITPSIEHYFVEQIEGYPGRHKAKRTGEDYTVAFSLEEPTLANMKIAWDITNATAGVDPITLDFGGDSVDPQERVLVVTGLVPNTASLVRTITFDRAIASGPGEYKITDFEETKLPCSFTLLYSSANSRLGEISDDQ